MRCARILSLSLLLLATTAGAVVKTVALQGDGSPAGGPYKRFRLLQAVTDAAGERVVFFNPTAFGDKCLFRVDPDAAGSSLACHNTPSPDGRTFIKIGDPSINAAGIPAFASQTSGGTDGAYKGQPPTTVAITSDPVGGGAFLDTISFGRINTLGDVVFLSTLTGAGPNAAGIYRCTGGDGNCSPNTIPPGTGVLTQLVRVGDSVTDRAGREFCSLTTVQASSYGIVFSATTKLDCNDGGELPASGVFRMAFAGVPETIALQTEASGVNTTTFSSFRGTPVIVDTGTVAFYAGLAGVPSSAIFRCQVGTCPPTADANAVVQRGESDDDGNAFLVLSAPGLSTAGDVAFTTRLGRGPAGGATGVYVWRSASDTFEKIAIRNDPVPDIMGATFNTIYVKAPAMSLGGRVVFKSRIKRVVPPRTRQGIFISE